MPVGSRPTENSTAVARRAVIAGTAIAVASWLVACGPSAPTKPSTTPPTATGMLITGSSPTVGNSSQFTANVSLSDRTSADVTSTATWQSSDTTVATVNGAGLVTGLKVGSAEITATYQSVVGRLPVAVQVACVSSVQPSDVTFPPEGGSITLTVTVAPGLVCNWAAQLNQGFFSFVGANSGTGSGAITIAAAANSGSSRSGLLTLSGRTVTLRQSQLPCATGLSLATQLFSAAGGVSTGTVSAPAGCTWTVSSTQPFVTITAGASGTGAGNFTYSVEGNSFGIRQATLSVEQYTSPLTQAGPEPGTTYLRYVSDPGDSIGQGLTFNATLSDAPFIATVDPTLNHVLVTVNMDADSRVGPGGWWWRLNLSALKGQPLVFGSYYNATRYPFQLATAPGLDFSGSGRGCNQVTGSFQTIVAEFGSGPTVNRFWATFEQHCEGRVAALRGEISFVR